MRAVEIAAFGGPERLALVERAAPVPGPGEIAVAIEFAGLNYIDVYMRDGSYRRSGTYQTPLPMVLGMEGAGRVAALGPGLDGWKVGQRVAYCLSRGAYAEVAVVPAGKLVPVPDHVPLETATALMLQGSTAHYLTHSLFPLAPGQSCLVHAGAGGVGQLLIQLATLRGARVITTVGSAEKADLARARGADHAILYREVDFAAEVRRLTDGRGVDVVYDSVGRDTVPGSLKCLKRRGLLVNFGASSGQADPIAPLDLAEAGSVFLTRPHLADYMTTPDEIRGRAEDLFAAVGAGRLTVTIDSVLDLAAAGEAHRRIESRQTRGKILLRIGQGNAG